MLKNSKLKYVGGTGVPACVVCLQTRIIEFKQARLEQLI
jgi:hypothetical protein